MPRSSLTDPSATTSAASVVVPQTVSADSPAPVTTGFSGRERPGPRLVFPRQRATPRRRSRPEAERARRTQQRPEPRPPGEGQVGALVAIPAGSARRREDPRRAGLSDPRPPRCFKGGRGDAFDDQGSAKQEGHAYWVIRPPATSMVSPVSQEAAPDPRRARSELRRRGCQAVAADAAPDLLLDGGRHVHLHLLGAD
jgi:hypothetical protein